MPPAFLYPGRILLCAKHHHYLLSQNASKSSVATTKPRKRKCPPDMVVTIPKRRSLNPRHPEVLGVVLAAIANRQAALGQKKKKKKVVPIKTSR